MYFRNSLKVLLIFAGIILLSCDKKGSNVINPNYISTVDQLKEFISNINFQAVMADGYTVNIPTQNIFTGINNTNFTSPDNGINFTRLETFQLNQSQGNATLVFDINEYKFDMVFVVTMKELEDYFDNYTVDPSLYNWLFYVAIDGSNYSKNEVITGSVKSGNNFLNILVSPNVNEFFYGAFQTNNDQLYYLASIGYNLNINDLTSSGYIYPSGNTYLNEKYNLYIKINN